MARSPFKRIDIWSQMNEFLRRVEDMMQRFIEMGGYGVGEVEEFNRPDVKGYVIRSHWSSSGENPEPQQLEIRGMEDFPMGEPGPFPVPFEPRPFIPQPSPRDRRPIRPFPQPFFETIDDEDNIVVVAEIPVVHSDNIAVDGTDTDIEISVGGRFLRRLELPAPVDIDRAQARCQNGVLEVVLPKKREE